MFDWLNGATPGTELNLRHRSGWLAKELPEVDRLYGVPQRAEHHPEVDTGAHIELCLDVAAALQASESVRVAVLLHDLGKAVTDPEKWPAHVDHEKLGVPWVARVAERFSLDEYTAQLATLVCEFHLQAHRAFDMRPQSIIALLEDHLFASGVSTVEDFLTACEADARGRLGRHDSLYRQGQYLRACALALKDLPSPSQAEPQSKLWQDLHRNRLNAVRGIHRDFKSTFTAEMC